jgi:hypothetical protein
MQDEGMDRRASLAMTYYKGVIASEARRSIFNGFTQMHFFMESWCNAERCICNEWI